MDSETDEAWARRQFTRSDGRYRFARWGRPVVPAVFGAGEAGAAALTEGLRAVAGLTGLGVAEEDPELGVNSLLFTVAEWRDLTGVPHLGRLVPDLDRLVSTLAAAAANQYRIFDVDAVGAIRLCITLIRLDAEMRATPVRALALGQAAMGLLLWSDHAFLDAGPVAVADGRAVLVPRVAALMRAAYDPDLPAATTDPAHAAHLAERMAGA